MGGVQIEDWGGSVVLLVNGGMYADMICGELIAGGTSGKYFGV
jgi:hypothetical protein